MAFRPSYTDPNRKPSFAHEDSAEIRIQIDRIIYSANNFIIAAVTLLADKASTNPARQRLNHATVVVGKVGALDVNRIYIAVGKFVYSKRGEWQIEISGASPEDIEGADNIRRFLDTIENVGPVRSRKILAAYGDATLKVLDGLDEETFIDTLHALTRCGITRAEAMYASYKEHRDEFETISLVNGIGISDADAETLRRLHPKTLKADIAKNPELVFEEVDLSFPHSDELWRRCGIKADDIRRIACGVRYALSMYVCREGHCWATTETALMHAAKVLNMPDLADRWFAYNYEAAPEMQRQITVDAYGNIWPRYVWTAEERVAEHIKRLNAHTVGLPTNDKVTAIVQSVVAKSGMKLAPGQLQALIAIPQRRVSLLTGSAGCGKTTITRLLIEVFTQLGNRNIIVMAPTGAAARRSTRATGTVATTIHKGIGYVGSGKALHDAENPLDAPVVIVDESSMIEIRLASYLLAAVKTGASVVFVGDPNQLPAIGPGALLRDLISAGIGHSPLKDVFRSNGALLNFAYAILTNKPMRLLDANGKPIYSDIDYIPVSGSEFPAIVRREVVKQYLAAGGPDEIKVLAYKNGTRITGGDRLYDDGCVRDLNLALADLNRNQGGMTVTSFDEEFCDGHRILWLKNSGDDSLPLVNGQDCDIVMIEEDPEDNEIYITIRTLNIIGDLVTYRFKFKDHKGEFQFGYARTYHKSQGDEYKKVVMVVRPGDRLSLEAVYTAATRAKQELVIIGDINPIWKAVRTTHTRRTGLVEKLRARPMSDDVDVEGVLVEDAEY